MRRENSWIQGKYLYSVWRHPLLFCHIAILITTNLNVTQFHVREFNFFFFAI